MPLRAVPVSAVFGGVLLVWTYRALTQISPALRKATQDQDCWKTNNHLN